MKWLFWILAIATMVAAVPSAHAAISFQSVGNGLMDFSGPSRLAVTGTGNSFTANWGPSYANVASAGPNRGGYMISLQRPTYVQQHSFDDYNQNYRTVEHGAWQVRSVQAHSQNAAFNYRNTYAGPLVSGYVGNPTGTGVARGYGRASSYAYTQHYNIQQIRSPWASRYYQQPGTLSSYTAPGRTYY